MSETEETPNERKQRDPIYLVIIGLLLIVIATLGWQLYEKSSTIEYISDEKEELDNEKEQVKDELDQMLQKYDDMETDNDSLNDLIKEEKERIKELRDSINRYQYSLSKAQDEARTLRDIMQGYVEDIDSLQQANKRLTEENQEITEELGKTRTEKEELEDRTQNMEEDLDKASVLKTSNIRATGIRHNLLGNPKETERASRTEKFKTCFTVNSNEFAEEGERDLHLRIVDPSGQIFAKNKDGEPQKFEFEGVRGQYTLKHRIEYEKEEMDLCLYFNLEDDLELEEGEYVVKIYESQKEIGSESFILE